MELIWLEDFLSLARTGNFSRSAEDRYVSQSAFSRRIQALENWLGVPLVDRSTYPTKLTPEGVVFRETAESLLRQMYQIRDELQDSHQDGIDTIRITALHTIALSFFPKWSREIERHLGKLNTRLSARNMHDCVQGLIEGHADFAICFAHPAIPLLLDGTRHPFRTIGADRMMPVSRPARNGRPMFRLPGTEKRPVPLLAYAPESFLGRCTEWTLKNRNAAIHVRRTYQNSMAEGLKAMALEGHGLAWLPESSIANDLMAGRLVQVGGSNWVFSMEIRIYRSVDKSRDRVEEMWTCLSDSLAE